MHRLKRLALLVVIVIGAVAAAPADGDPPEGIDHLVELGPDATEATVQGGLPGGANLSPFIPDQVVPQGCGKDVADYCEFVLIRIDNPVEDLDPEDPYEAKVATIDMDVTADVPGSDFDLFLFESDETGTRGFDLASSGNAPGCAQLCSEIPQAYTNVCDGTDECVSFNVVTTEGRPTVWVLAEIVYFTTPAGYSANVTATGIG